MGLSCKYWPLGQAALTETEAGSGKGAEEGRGAEVESGQDAAPERMARAQGLKEEDPTPATKDPTGAFEHSREPADEENVPAGQGVHPTEGKVEWESGVEAVLEEMKGERIE